MESRNEERESRREERHRAEEQAHEKERRQRLLKLTSAAGFLAVIAVVVAIVISQSGGSDGGGGTDVSGVETVSAELKGLPQNGAVIGDPNAKVTLIEYGDPQCPTCKLYADQVIPGIISGSVRSGDAKIEFRPWIVIGPQSKPASEAAYAAGEQGRFWNYIELFYLNQGEENSGYVTDDFMTAVAKTAGVPDIAKWNRDRKDSRWQRLFAQHDRQASNFGFNGTPSFAVESGGQTKPLPAGPGNTTTPPSTIEAAIRQSG